MRTVSLPPAPGVVTSQWELEIEHAGRIYTMEHIRTLPFFLESWFLSTPLFTSLLAHHWLNDKMYSIC